MKTKKFEKIIKRGLPIVLAGTIAATNVMASNLEQVSLNATTGVSIYLRKDSVNSDLFVPKDVNGNEVTVFAYNGTTYLPIRAISNVFNADIKWNSIDNSISITTNGQKLKYEENPPLVNNNDLKNETLKAYKGMKVYIDGKEFIPKDVNGNVVDIYVINGTTYLPIRAICDVYGAYIEWTGHGVEISSAFTFEDINYPYLSKKFNEQMSLTKKLIPLIVPYIDENARIRHNLRSLGDPTAGVYLEIKRMYEETNDPEIKRLLEEYDDYYDRVDDYVCYYRQGPDDYNDLVYIAEMCNELPQNAKEEETNIPFYEIFCFNPVKWLYNNFDELKEKASDEEIAKWYQEGEDIYNKALAIYKKYNKTLVLE